MGCHPYMAQVWVEATYDMIPMRSIFILGSSYGFFTWHYWLKIIVPCKCEGGLLETPIVDQIG